MTAFCRPEPRAVSEALAALPMLRTASFNNTVLVPIVEAAFAAAQTLPAVTDEAVDAARRAPRSSTGFKASLARPGQRFIMEIKTASPSKGAFATGLDIPATVRVYNRFADAMSVLTEKTFFGGSFERLAAIRPQTALPLLAKDFIVDERQLLAARAAGADAALLMLSVLSAEGYKRLAAFADRLGLETLTEVSNDEELADAIALGAPVIGLNNRNLRDLTIDLSRTEQLAPAIPSDRVIVTESGLKTRSDLTRLAHHADAFLVGSALCGAPDLSVAVRELLFGQSKVCGLTRAEDALTAAQAGATAVGLVLAADSPRGLSPEKAPALALEIRTLCKEAGLPVRITAVARTTALPQLLPALKAMAPDTLELHGTLTAGLLLAYRQTLPCVRLTGALSTAADPLTLDAVRKLQTDGFLDTVLLDSAAGGKTGGTGLAAAPDALPSLSAFGAVELAGGLCAANIGAVAGRPFSGFHFNSAVESVPGVKDPAKVRAAFAALTARPQP